MLSESAEENLSYLPHTATYDFTPPLFYRSFCGPGIGNWFVGAKDIRVPSCQSPTASLGFPPALNLVMQAHMDDQTSLGGDTVPEKAIPPLLF